MNSRRNSINDPSLAKAERLAALRSLVAEGPISREAAGEVNNHVHTCYSFSPYTPSMAVLKAFETGLDAVGSVDHDSIGAAGETIEAGKTVGMATTVGFELRVSFEGTGLETKRINFPECLGKAYMVFHGVPETSFKQAESFLKPLRALRVERTRAMTQAMGRIFAGADLPLLDFDRQVVPLTQLSGEGGVTERHLCAAAAQILIDHAGSAGALPGLLQARLEIQPGAKVAALLCDPDNPHRLYDLVGVLKTTLLERVFIEPGDECVPVKQAVELARSLGAIPAYAYLGDVGQSPTGDKKAETYEDSYLDELVEVLVKIGFQAVTYMPPRNTLEQLLRVQKLCARHELMEISGVDINSSRQSFHCPEILRPEFAHLNESTWALIAHEKLAARQPELGLFHPRNPLSGLSLGRRLTAYALSGRAMNPQDPTRLPLPKEPQ